MHEHHARVYESERIGALAWTQQYDAEVGGHYFLNTATVNIPESATLEFPIQGESLSFIYY